MSVLVVYSPGVANDLPEPLAGAPLELLEQNGTVEDGACRLSDEFRELTRVLVGNPQTGEIHGSDVTP